MGILSIAAIIISLIAISRTNDASLKIAKLEKRLGKEDKVVSSAAVIVPKENVIQSSAVVMDTPVVEEKVPQIVVKKEQEKDSAFVVWLKEDWLLKLGGILVLMGVLFFLSVAYIAVGPQGKVAMGYIFGLALMFGGFKYAKRQLIGGSAIHLIGAIVIIITTYLARQPSYNLFDPYLATLLMFITTVCVALTAFFYNRPQLAHVGLLLASLVPFLTNTENGSFLQILLYLGVVTLGVLWLALVTKWRTLVLLALSIVCLYSIGKIGGGSISFAENYVLVVFGILFYVTSLFSILRSNGVTQHADGITALLNAGFALMWITSQASHEMAPIIIAIVGLAYAAGFFFVYKITNVYTSFLVYGGVALGLLTTSVMMQISGRSLTLVLLLMGAGVTIFTYYLSKNESITKTVAFFNILPLFYVFGSILKIEGAISYPAGSPDVWKDLLIVGIATAIYFSLYAYFARQVKDLSYVSLGVAILMVVISVWQIMHLVIGGVFATSLALFVITVGLTLFTYMFSKNEDSTTKVALCTVIPLFYVFGSFASISRSIAYPANSPDVWKDWVVVVLAMAICFSLYGYFINRIKSLGYAMSGVGAMLVVIFVWQLLHLVVGGNFATFISLLLYTLAGLFVLFQGTQETNTTKIKFAKIWLGVIAAHVILIDAWQVGNTTLGILICIVVGILLLSTTFINRKTEN